jgi:predicted nucleic acid-binding protein
MTLVVVYDANVLYPQSLCDLLVRLAQTQLFRAKWTHQILDETVDALAKRLPDAAPEKLQRRKQLMITAVRDCLVTDYEALVPTLALPDPDDRHVLAAAIRAHADLIVTSNLRDFPPDALRPYDVAAVSPDTFVSGLVADHGEQVAAIVTQIAADNRYPPRTVMAVLDSLERNGLARAVAELRALLH